MGAIFCPHNLSWRESNTLRFRSPPFVIGLCVIFCKATALRQNYSLPAKKFVGRNSLTYQAKIFVLEEADKTQEYFRISSFEANYYRKFWFEGVKCSTLANLKSRGFMKNTKQTQKGRSIFTVILTAVITFVLTAALFSLLFLDGKVLKLKLLDYYVSNYYIGEVDSKDTENFIMSGYISSLNDKYASFFPAEEAENRSNRLVGVENGLGITVFSHPDNNTVCIKSVASGSSADKAGLLKGDEIFQVDGQNVTNMNLNDAVNLIKREIGETVNLKIYRNNAEIDIAAEYSNYTSQSVYYHTIEDFGYVEIYSFNSQTVPQFKTAVENLVSSGVKGLIFDVRGNGGGTVDSVEEIVDYLVPEGVIMTSIYKNGDKEELFSDANEIDLPMAVLTDKATASAAELFSASIRDFNKGVLVGTTTYGKAVMQGTFDFPDKSSAVFTIAEFYTHSGETYNKIGLEPDIKVELNENQTKYFNLLADNEDPVKMAAVEYLKGVCHE